MIKTAVIMAAGMGTRFGNVTEIIPKGFVVAGGLPMIERSIQILKKNGIERIIIGTGYRKEHYEDLAKRVSGIECVFSPLFEETNSMYTLWNCRNVIGDDDFLLLESDLVFEEKAISSLIACEAQDVMLITPVTKFQDQYYVETDENSFLTRCSINKEELIAKGELVGIHKISNRFYKQMCNEFAKIVDEQPKLGYEYELLYMSQHISPLFVLNLKGLIWYEIDDNKDLEYAEKHILTRL